MNRIHVSLQLARMEESLVATSLRARIGERAPMARAHVALQLAVFGESRLARGFGAHVGLVPPVLQLVPLQVLRREKGRVAALALTAIWLGARVGQLVPPEVVAAREPLPAPAHSAHVRPLHTRQRRRGRSESPTVPVLRVR